MKIQKNIIRIPRNIQIVNTQRHKQATNLPISVNKVKDERSETLECCRTWSKIGQTTQKYYHYKKKKKKKKIPRNMFNIAVLYGKNKKIHVSYAHCQFDQFRDRFKDEYESGKSISRSFSFNSLPWLFRKDRTCIFEFLIDFRGHTYGLNLVNDKISHPPGIF